MNPVMVARWIDRLSPAQKNVLKGVSREGITGEEHLTNLRSLYDLGYLTGIAPGSHLTVKGHRVKGELKTTWDIL
jgi:hypothetical protein